MPEIALVAGESSGDASGGALVRELLALEPGLSFWGAGGVRMRDAGVDLVADLSGGGAIGVVQSLRLVPELVWDYLRVKRAILKRSPDLLILIDFGAFNVRLGRAAKKKGIKTLYYFPPSSWRKRLKSTDSIKACADKVITPFPWSEVLLKEGGVDAAFLGHPLLDMVKPACSREEFCARTGLDRKSRIVGILPGSRGHEIDYNLPAMLEASAHVSSKLSDVQFVIAAGNQQSRKRVERIKGRLGSTAVVAQGSTYDVMAHSETLLTCSGTATLESAILGTPMVIIYRGGGAMVLEYLLRRARVLESFIGMPNIIAEKEICPELVAEEATPKAIAEAALAILDDDALRLRMIKELEGVREALGQPGGTARAARAVLDMIKT